MAADSSACRARRGTSIRRETGASRIRERERFCNGGSATRVPDVSSGGCPKLKGDAVSRVNGISRIEELRRALSKADASAFLVEGRVIRRVIREQFGYWVFLY